MKKFLTLILIFLPLVASALASVVEVDTGGHAINAIKGEVRIPPDINITGIHTGRSVVVLWIEMPVLDYERNVISFSGITPGGFQGKYPLFSIEGEMSEADLNKFVFSNVESYSADGAATAVEVELDIKPSNVSTDVSNPEEFDLVISSSPEIFDGRRFLSFIAQDKGKGIKKYEYAHSLILTPRDEKWVEVSSPFELPTRALWSKIYIRAVDHDGNTQVASVAGPYYYLHLLIWVIIILSITWVLSYRRSGVL